MKKNKLIPKRRFKDFINDDAWEQCKLGDVARFGKGKGYSKNDLIDKGTPIILYGSLYTDYRVLIEKVNTFAKPKNNSIYSMGNEVIVPSSGETAEDIARASVVLTKGILLGGDLNILQLDDNFSSAFVALSISNGERKRELAKMAQGKSVVHLYNSDLKELKLIYPPTGEQKRIAVYFNQLDNLITLHHLFF